MKRRELLEHLRDQGCEQIREGGRHSWWGHAANNTRTSVPRHTEVSDDLAK